MSLHRAVRTAVVVLAVLVAVPVGPAAADTQDAPSWVAREDGSGRSDFANAVAVSPRNGNVHVVGSRAGSGATVAAALTAYDSTGRRLWQRGFQLPARFSSARAQDVVVHPTTGDVYVLLATQPGGGLDRPGVLAYSASGQLRWQYLDRRGDDAQVFAVTMELDARRGVVHLLARGAPLDDGDTFAASIAVDATTGLARWVADYESPDGDYLAEDLALDPASGNVYVTGRNTDALGTDTVAYSPAGGQLWAARERDGSLEEGNAVEADPVSGNVYVAGSTVDLFARGVLQTVAYDAAGNRRWERREGYGGRPDSDIAIAPDTGAVVVASTPAAVDGGVVEVLTRAYSPSGQRLWRASVDDADVPTSELVVEVAIDPATALIHVGHGFRAEGSPGYALTSLDAHGQVLRVERYAQPGGTLDFADLAVGPSGVYLTGYADDGGPPSDTDWLTVAYPAS